MISEWRSEKAVFSGSLITLTLGMLSLETQPPFCQKPKTLISGEATYRSSAEPMFESSQPRYQIGESRSLPMVLDLTPLPVVPVDCLQLAMTKL